MIIILNNRNEEFTEETITVNQVLALKKLSFKMRIIKINGVLISKTKYASTVIHDGDNVQILYLMSGG